jgi:hypothetical protein
MNKDELLQMRNEKHKLSKLKELEANYPVLVPILKKMLAQKPAERIDLNELLKILEPHLDKITEIDEIEYLKQYEVIFLFII